MQHEIGRIERITVLPVHKGRPQNPGDPVVVVVHIKSGVRLGYHGIFQGFGQDLYSMDIHKFIWDCDEKGNEKGTVYGTTPNDNHR